MIVNLLSVSSLLLTLTCPFLTFILLVYGKTKLHRIWAFFNITVFLWGIGVFLVTQSKTDAQAIFYWKIAHVGSLFIATVFLHTVFVFCELNRRKFLIFAYCQSTIFVVLDFLGLGGYSVQLLFNDTIRYVKTTGFQYLIFLNLWALLVLYGLYELFKFYIKARGHRKSQILYFIIGLLFGFIGGSTHHLTVMSSLFNREIYPFGQLGVALYCVIATYAILKYRLMDIRVVITRAFAFLVSYPVFLGIPFFFAYRMQPFLYPLLGMNWWLVPSALLLLFATLAPSAYSQIHGRMENALLAEQKRYQKLLLQAASGMVVEHNLNRLSKLIVYIVKRIVRIDFASIFLADNENRLYRLKAMRNSQQSHYKEMSFLFEHPFSEYLKSHREPFLFEELPLELQNSLNTPQHVGLIIPSYVEEELLGFVFLGEKTNRGHYTEDDINVFKILATQAALAIKNCLFLEESKKAQERIFTAEKLASIGGMADGVAHQIKNRLNQFSVASGELKFEVKDFIDSHKELIEKNPELKTSFDYLTKISESLISNVKKTDSVVKGILQFARVEEKETFFANFSLKEILALATELLRIKHEIAEAPLATNLDSQDDTIYGVKSQITEAIYNIIDNAYEATQEKIRFLDVEEKKVFKPLIELKLTQKSDSSYIEITDNGIGIKKEDIQKIFAPFFTTKSSYKSGSGIGMYVVKRMIEENHKGKVRFSSAYMEGTKFFIELPKKVI
ncbi:MAG: GAF domain-containing protein [Candidatus Omnitrophica bacterium]|jgi:signal transduction histidine kinase|nr:GAF domain-containing protein [Candidatus Omnitrophota bacterium]